MRVLAEVRDGVLQLRSRNENDVTVAFPELHGLAGVGHDVVLDGEVVAFADGVPPFCALADRMHVRNARPRRAAVAGQPGDAAASSTCSRLDGEDLTGRPLAERRAPLEGLDLLGRTGRCPATYDDGAMLLQATGRAAAGGDRVQEASSPLPSRAGAPRTG